MAGRNGTSEMGRSIAVLGTHDPGRSLAISALLCDYIDRHGWGDRIAVTAAGYASGAGPASATLLSELKASGLRPAARSCPDIEDDAAPIASADWLVVGTDEEADLFQTWPEAGGKIVYALTDFLGEEGWAVGDPGAELDRFVDQVTEAVPLVLRSIIAREP